MQIDRESQTAKGKAIIASENAEIGQTVLWMGGIDIGPILDDAVERERVRASVDFARRIMDLHRVIAKQTDRIRELCKSVNKQHEREISDGELIGKFNKLKRELIVVLSNIGIDHDDLISGLRILSSNYHAMLLNVNPEINDD